MSNIDLQIVDIQPYEWVSSDSDNIFTIRIWGHDKDSERVLLRIEDYQPFCRLELPNAIGGKPVRWNQEALRVYANWIRSALKEHSPSRIIYKEMKKVYWYKPEVKYPFFICYFTTEEAMIHCTKLINKGGYMIKSLGFIKSRVWETSITSVHRLVTDAELGYGQWLRAKVKNVSELDRISTCQNEYIASYRDLVKLSEEETKGWGTKPLVAAIDIECYSQNHRAMPNMSYAQDVIYQLSYIIQRLGDPSSRKKYLLVVGECDDIPGAEVIRYDHEISLIDGLCDIINKTDPTILTGYNIFKFDFPYMDARVKMYLRDWKRCGLIKDQQSRINIRKWKSSAYGFVTLATLEAEGRICIDMFTLVKRDHKLDRYTLDFVSHHFLGKGKHDITPKQMFEIYKESQDACESCDVERIRKSSKDIARVGAYCLEDSCLCIDLMEALSTWIMLIELSTIVQVTVTEIFTRGQQIRVQNQVYSMVYKEDFVIDERPGSSDSFKGGQVFDLTPGKYNNILIFDFASLYPSIIRAFNICYSTLVPDEADIPDSMCHILQWDQKEEDDTHKFFRYKFIKREHFHGFLPRMCEHLVKARKETRQQISPKNDNVTNIVLNQRQLGLKISANSIFGSLGVREGRMPLPEGAQCITAMGRQLITIAANHIEKTKQGKIVYGDSVTGDTPILIRRNDNVNWVCIQDLCAHVRDPYNKTNTDIESLGYEVWSDKGWTKIKNLICHKTRKKIYKVLTHTGCVDVTEDHSLLLSNGTEIQSNNLEVGNALLHRNLPPLPNNGSLTEEEAWILGAFYKDRKHTADNLYEKYRDILHDSHNHKIVLDEVMKAPHKSKMAFLKGYHTDNLKTEITLNFNSGEKIEAARLFHLLVDLGYNVSIESQRDKPEAYQFNINKDDNGNMNVIKEITQLAAYDDYVYDLETENHHFAAGIGRLIVHNTDSVMVDAKITDPHECVSQGERLSKELSALYPPPLYLEFERALSVALFIKKKKYAGVPLAIIRVKSEDKIEEVEFAENNKDVRLKLWKVTQIREDERKQGQMKTVIHYIGVPRDISLRDRSIIAGMPLLEGGSPNTKDLLKKGVVLARRDNCLWMRETYLKVLLNILFDKPLYNTLDLINEEILAMMRRQIPFNKMLITGEIGSNYKPNSTYFIKLFSDELTRQGNPIQRGERFDYVFVRSQEEWRNEKQGYKMRLPEMFWENCYNEPLDVAFYVTKLQNPVEQILYLGYKNIIDDIEKRCEPTVKRRKKIYTYIKHDYINTWTKLIDYKQNAVNHIKMYKPHFYPQEPYFTIGHMDDHVEIIFEVC